jgi:hypothetical protein
MADRRCRCALLRTSCVSLMLIGAVVLMAAQMGQQHRHHQALAISLQSRCLILIAKQIER